LNFSEATIVACLASSITLQRRDRRCVLVLEELVIPDCLVIPPVALGGFGVPSGNAVLMKYSCRSIHAPCWRRNPRARFPRRLEPFPTVEHVAGLALARPAKHGDHRGLAVVGGRGGGSPRTSAIKKIFEKWRFSRPLNNCKGSFLTTCDVSHVMTFTRVLGREDLGDRARKRWKLGTFLSPATFSARAAISARDDLVGHADLGPICMRMR